MGGCVGVCGCVGALDKAKASLADALELQSQSMATVEGLADELRQAREQQGAVCVSVCLRT